MSTVGTTTFVEDGPKNYFTLQNEQYIRRFNYKNWNTLGVGVLFSIQGTTNVTGGLWIGLGSSANGAGIGFKNGIASIGRIAGVANGFLGSLLGYGSTWNNCPYNTDVSGSYITIQGIIRVAISGSATQGSLANGYNCLCPTTESTNRKAIAEMITFDRSGNNLVITGYYLPSYAGLTNHNHTDGTLCSALADTYADGVAMISPSVLTMTGGPTDETNYPFDTINIFWTGSVPIRVYQIAVRTIQ